MPPNPAQGTHARGVVEALVDHTETIAIDLLGDPTSRTPREYRWGRHGSLWLCRAGPKRGRWYDHERGEGGDILDLIAREHRASLSEVIRLPLGFSAATDGSEPATIGK